MKVSLPLAEPEVVCTESGHFAASLAEVDHMDNGCFPHLITFSNCVYNPHLWICFQTPFFRFFHYSQECFKFLTPNL